MYEPGNYFIFIDSLYKSLNKNVRSVLSEKIFRAASVLFQIEDIVM